MRYLIHTILVALMILFAVGSRGIAAEPPTIIAPSPENEAVIVRLPNDELRIFYVHRPEGTEICSIRSRNNGASWGEPQTEIKLPGAAYYALQVAVDRTGELQMVFHIAGKGENGYNGKHYDLYHVRTTGGRSAWGTPTRIYEGYVGSIRGLITLANGRLVLAVGVAIPSRVKPDPSQQVDLGWNDVRVFYSDDDGANWSSSIHDLQIVQDQTRGKTRYGAVEPSLIQLRDRRLWMLIRSKNGQLYESSSTDNGNNWSAPTPSIFTSSDSPAAIVRDASGQLLVFFNQCQRWDDPKSYAIGGRQVLHAAISTDEGKTWRGAREIIRDESGEAKGDRGTSYPSAASAADGSVILAAGQGEGRRRIVRVDPEWLLQTSAADDFSDGIPQWSCIEGAGLTVQSHPSNASAKVIALRVQDATKRAAACWNFPATQTGELNLRLMLEHSASDAIVSLTDHYSVASDVRANENAVVSFTLNELVRPGEWHDVKLSWSSDSTDVEVTIDAAHAVTLKRRRVSPIGINYLRITCVGDVNGARLLIASASATATTRNSESRRGGIRIAFLGDSITKGERPARGEYGPVSAQEAFTGRLPAMLKSAGIDATVINAGVSGDRSDRALERLDALLKQKPTHVAIMFGTNDSCIDLNASEPRVSLQAYAKNLAQILSRVRDAGAEPILMTEPPLGSAWVKGRNPIYAEKGNNFSLEKYMNAVRAQALESHTPLIDHYEMWTKAGTGEIDKRLLDGCHPNAEGHRVMAEAICAFLANRLTAATSGDETATKKRAVPPIIAHRGASDDAPENTLASYRLAIEQRADGLEGDFYLTSDGQIVCMHDANTKRTTGVDRPIVEQTMAELKQLDAGSWKDPRFANEHPPTLAEVLDVLPANMQFYLEIKCGTEILPAFKAVVEASKARPEQLRIIGFRAEVIAAARKAMPQIKAFWLTGFKALEGDTLKHPTANEIIETLKATGANGVGCQGDLAVIDAKFVRVIHDAGFEVHVWTVDQVEDAKKMIEMGVDSITTNRPAYMRRELE